MVWGAYRHSFLFPLVDFLKISGAAFTMVVALSFMTIKPQILSLTVAIGTGVIIYGCMMGVLYPERTRSFWDKIKGFSRA
jgi:hypothetical protein